MSDWPVLMHESRRLFWWIASASLRAHPPVVTPRVDRADALRKMCSGQPFRSASSPGLSEVRLVCRASARGDKRRLASTKCVGRLRRAHTNHIPISLASSLTKHACAVPLRRSAGSGIAGRCLLPKLSANGRSGGRTVSSVRTKLRLRNIFLCHGDYQPSSGNDVIESRLCFRMAIAPLRRVPDHEVVDRHHVSLHAACRRGHKIYTPQLLPQMRAWPNLRRCV
jgi:hypothetical protein